MTQVVKPTRVRRPLRSRLFRALLWVAAIAVVTRLLLTFGLPYAVRIAAGAVGLDARAEDVTLAILHGKLTIQGLVLRDKSADGKTPGPELASLDYLHADISMGDLWHGRIVIERAEVDGVRGTFARNAQGLWNWSLFNSGPAIAAPVAAPPAIDAAESDAVFDPGNPILTIREARVRNVRVRYSDLTADPPVRVDGTLDVSVNGFSIPYYFDSADVLVTSPQGLDLLQTQASFTHWLEDGELSVGGYANVKCIGFHAEAIRGLLKPLGIVPDAVSVSAAVNLQISGQEEARSVPYNGLDASERRGWRLYVNAKDALVIADGERRARLETVHSSFSLTPGRRLWDLDARVDGVTGGAERLADGTMRALGLRFGSAAAGASVVKPATGADSTQPLLVEVNSLDVGRVSASFRDHVGDEPVDLTADLALLTLRNVTNDPSSEMGKGRIEIRGGFPGIAEKLDVKVETEPLHGGGKVAVEAALSEITLARVKPYLEAASLRSEFRSGQLTTKFQLSGRAFPGEDPEVAGRVDDLTLVEAGQEEALFQTQLDLDSAKLSPEALHVGTVRIPELRLPIRIHENGELSLVGLRFLAAAAAEAGAVDEKPEPSREARGSTVDLSRLQLGQAWLPLTHPFPGETRRTLALIESGELRDFHLGPGLPKPATLNVKGSVEGFVSSVEVDATATPRGDPVDLTAVASVKFHGIHTEYLAPVLARSGFESVRPRRDVELTLEARTRVVNGILERTLGLRDLAFSAEGSQVAGIGAVKISRLRLEGGALKVESIRVEDPVIQASRAADGTITIAGFRSAPASAALESRPVGRAPRAQAPADPPEPALRFEIGEVALTNAAIDWKDLAIPGGIDTKIRLDARATRPASGPGAAAFPVDVRFGATGLVDSVHARADMRLDATRTDLTGTLDVAGARGAGLSAYLPPSTRLSFENGTFDARFAVTLDTNADLTRSAAIELANVQWRDGAEAPAFRFDRFALRAPKLDAGANFYHIEELTLEGTDLRAVKTGPKTLDIMGLTFQTPDFPTEGTAPESVSVAPVPAPGQPSARRVSVPDVQLDRLRIGVKSLTYRDATNPEAEPVVAVFSIENSKPLRMGLTHAEEQRENTLHFTGRIPGVVGSIDMLLTGAPLVLQPEFEVRVHASGIDGREIVRRFSLPLEAKDMTNGDFTAHLDVDLDIRRSNPFDFSLTRPFGFSASLDNVALRGVPEGPILAGLEALHVDAKRVDLPGRNLQLTRIELTRPTGRLLVDKEGMHALGFLRPAPEPAHRSHPAESAPLTSAPAESAPAASGPAGAPPVKPWEISLGALSVSGLDFEFRDATYDPPLIVPLTGLDVDIRRFSTRAFHEDLPFRFYVHVDAGNVPLPLRYQSSSLLAGFVSGAVNLAISSQEVKRTQDRPLLEDLSVSGQLVLNGPPRGFVNMNLGGLELASLRGLAKKSGVTIGDGVLDTHVKVVCKGAGGIDIDTRNTFAHLSIEESAGGPISTYLKLPAPLDSVLFILRNENNEQRVNFNVHVGAEGISEGAIVSEALAALGTAIARAVAGAPLRMLDMVKGAVPIDMERATDKLRTGRVPFDPAERLASSDDWRGIQMFIDDVKHDSAMIVKLQHEFALADMEKLDRLANPTPEECLAYTAALRQRRFELFRQRDELAARARTSFWIGRLSEAEDAMGGVRALEHLAGEVEASLDEMIGRTRTRAPGAAQRRTRVACIALANRRLEEVKQQLVQRGVPAERVEVRPARVDLGEDCERSGVLLTMRRQN